MLQDLEENNKALVSSSERMRAELERVVKECGLLRRQVGRKLSLSLSLYLCVSLSLSTCQQKRVWPPPKTGGQKLVSFKEVLTAYNKDMK